MSGRVRRHRQYADYLKKIAHSQDSRAGADYLPGLENVPLKYEQERAFIVGITQGLLMRLHRKTPRDFDVILEILDRCQKDFLLYVHEEGILKSQVRVAEQLAYWGSRDMTKLRKPLPIQLLKEGANFQEQLPSKDAMDKRRQFLLDRELKGHLADESDADVTEAYLANRHRLSESEVHKLLARAARSHRT